MPENLPNMEKKCPEPGIPESSLRWIQRDKDTLWWTYCQLQTAPTMGTCHRPLQGLNRGHCSCRPATPLQRVQGGGQTQGALCSAKAGRTGLHIVRYFRSPILASPHIQKSTTFLHDDVCSLWLGETSSAKNTCLITRIPSSPRSHTYWPSTCLFGAVSQSYLKCCLLGYSPHIASKT